MNTLVNNFVAFLWFGSIVDGMAKEFFTRTFLDQSSIPSQEAVIDLVQPYLRLFWDSMMGPWEDFRERRASDRWFTDYTEEECAITLTMQANCRMRQELNGVEGIRVATQFRKPVFIVDEKIAISVKKLTKRVNKKLNKSEFVRSNYHTTRNKEYWAQRSIHSAPDLPRIMLGYQFLREITEMRLFLARSQFQGKAIAWAHTIPEPIYAATPQLLRTRHDDAESKGYEILPVEKQKQEGKPS